MSRELQDQPFKAITAKAILNPYLEHVGELNLMEPASLS